MLFSVIVPFFNEEKYLKDCISSLLAQDFGKDEFELIFVDNGSTDNSRLIVSRHKEITLLTEKRRNVYIARNRALEVAKGEIIAFTDADCVVCFDWLKQIYKGMNDADADIALGRVFFNKNISASLKMVENYQQARIEYLISNNHSKHFYGYTNNMAVKARLLRAWGNFRKWPVPGDTEIIHRCLLNCPGLKLVYLSEMKVVHSEVTNLGIWLKKNFIYGMHNSILEKNTGYAPLSFRLRLRVSLYCFRKNNYNFIQQLISIPLLRMCGFVYQFGRLIGKNKFSNFE